MSAPVIPRETLQKVRLFQNCSEEALDALQACMISSDIQPGEFIVKKGDIAQQMYFLIEGRVEVLTDSGKSIATLEPGSFFGEMGLVFNAPRTASVKALDKCHLYILQKEDFKKTEQKFPEIVKTVSQIAEERLKWFKRDLIRTGALDIENLSEEQIEKYRQVFCTVDEDGSGVIETDELGLLLQRLTGITFSEAERKRIMSKMDTDGNGSIDFEEFLKGLRHLKWLIPHEEEDEQEEPPKEESFFDFFALGNMEKNCVVM